MWNRIVRWAEWARSSGGFCDRSTRNEPDPGRCWAWASICTAATVTVSECWVGSRRWRPKRVRRPQRAAPDSNRRSRIRGGFVAPGPTWPTGCDSVPAAKPACRSTDSNSICWPFFVLVSTVWLSRPIWSANCNTNFEVMKTDCWPSFVILPGKRYFSFIERIRKRFKNDTSIKTTTFRPPSTRWMWIV